MDDTEYRLRIQTICLMVLTTVVLGYTVYWLRPVLLPFVIAVFVVSGLSPVLDFLQRQLHVARLVAAGIAFIAGMIVIVLLASTLWFSVVELKDSAPQYQLRMQQLFDRIDALIPDQSSADQPQRSSQEKLELLVDGMLKQGITLLSATMLNLFSTSVVVLIYVFFLLLGASNQLGLPTVWQEIDSQIREYLRLKTVISLITGVIFGGFLELMGVPMAVTFGLLAFLLNFIPNIGPLVATLLPIPLILLQPGESGFWIIGVITVLSAIQFVSGNIIEPQLMGDSTDLHPVVVLLALMFWGMMWGIVGMFLATPITAGLKIVLERIEATRPIARVLAGKWQTETEPVSPAEPTA